MISIHSPLTRSAHKFQGGGDIHLSLKSAMATKAPRRLRSSLRGRGGVDAHAVIVKKETERPATPSCSSENGDGESKLSSSAHKFQGGGDIHLSLKSAMATKAPRRLRSSLRGRGDVDAHAVIVKKETERPVTPSCSSKNGDCESKLSSSAHKFQGGGDLHLSLKSAMATKEPRRLRSSLRGRGDVAAHAVIVKKETERPVTPSCSSENDDGESKLSSSAPSPPIPDHVPSAPSRRLARDTSKDVLYAKGAAAQGMTNPGNRLFYRLCEDRYDEFAKLSPSDPNRKLLCGEIVDVIKATGGAFLKESGGIMKHGDVLNKVRDRLRQIGKPKLRPTGNFGPDDVVFSRGAANHLYPGNAKWRSLLDRYVISYYRHVVHPDGAVRDVPRSDLLPRPEIKRGHKGKFCKGNKGGIHNVRAGYQQDIIAETAQIIHDRGGKFRDERLNELCFGSIAEKTAGRFKDVKKELLSGNFKRSIDPTKMLGSNGENVDGEEGSADAVANAEEPVLTAAEIFHHRGGGFTSVKTIAAYKGPGIGYKPRKTKRRRSSTNSGAAKRAKRDNYNDSDDDDNSFKSEMLDSDSDLEISSDDEDGDSRDDDDSDNMPHKRIEKKRQAKEREQRLKRRKSRKVLHPQEQPRVKNHTRSMARKRSPSPKRKRKIIKQEEPSSSEEEDDTQQHPLSQYELYRLEKIKRNKAKLLELGLL